VTVTLSGDAQVVAVVAHPDDAEIMFYGSLRRWRDAGATVTVMAATDGTNGVARCERTAGRRLAPRHRPAESTQAFQGTGITVACLGMVDGALTPDLELISAIEDTLTRHRCTVLLTHTPHSGNDHQDHHAIARAALNAATRVPSCTTILHGQPHTPHHQATPSVLIDITDYLDAKIKALAAHRSQAGRYYLSESYTRWRATGEGWTTLPGHAAAGRSFEAFTPSLLLLHSSPDTPRNTDPQWPSRVWATGARPAHQAGVVRPNLRRVPTQPTEHQSAAIPADLRYWVTHRLGGRTATTTDVSWPRDNSMVWRIAADTTDAYVKISPNPQAFAREVHAYQHAAPQLDPDQAPRLLAADSDLLAILTSPLPGVIVKDQALPAAQELHAHELAGHLLGRWHTLSPPPPSASARQEAIASVATRADQAAANLEHTAHLLTERQRTLVEQACHDLPKLAEDLPLAYRHGDFAPRNWVWDADRRTLALFDFEAADNGIAVEDLVWLFATTWPTHPHLKLACLTGYGRDFSDAERQALPLFTALAATSYLHAGITLHEPGLVTKAQTAFEHLRISSS
jgi:LmbE family N-acetylglucosaminyl deacetylase/Ser/Thr protein kinase RdoA (MazF antagonist)